MITPKGIAEEFSKYVGSDDPAYIASITKSLEQAIMEAMEARKAHATKCPHCETAQHDLARQILAHGAVNCCPDGETLCIQTRNLLRKAGEAGRALASAANALGHCGAADVSRPEHRTYCARCLVKVRMREYEEALVP